MTKRAQNKKKAPRPLGNKRLASFEYQNDAWANPNLSDAAKLLISYLIARCGKNNTTWHSNAKIAEELGWSEASVIRAIRETRKWGYVIEYRDAGKRCLSPFWRLFLNDGLLSDLSIMLGFKEDDEKRIFQDEKRLKGRPKSTDYLQIRHLIICKSVDGIICKSDINRLAIICKTDNNNNCSPANNAPPQDDTNETEYNNNYNGGSAKSARQQNTTPPSGDDTKNSSEIEPLINKGINKEEKEKNKNSDFCVFEDPENYPVPDYLKNEIQDPIPESQTEEQPAPPNPPTTNASKRKMQTHHDNPDAEYRDILRNGTDHNWITETTRLTKHTNANIPTLWKEHRAAVSHIKDRTKLRELFLSLLKTRFKQKTDWRDKRPDHYELPRKRGVG